MRNFVIGCIVLFAMAGTAFSETKEPPKKLAADLGGGVKMEMVLIPAGEFLMGSPDRIQREPQHRVRITRPFFLGKCQVTQEQWQAVMGKNPSQFKGPRNPVENVSWDDCRQFVGQLNAKVGWRKARFALPTEAQWEYACRAGSTTRWCFGDDESKFGEYAWCRANSDGKTHPVGEKKPNAWGLYDMYGNVAEWCQDLYDAAYYEHSPKDDPTGPATGKIRVFRGGCWDFKDCGSATRGHSVPRSRSFYMGFRVALVPTHK